MPPNPHAPRDVTDDGPPFRIDADGAWWHGETRIARMELVKLFSSILQRTEDGRYWMVNPAERCHVTVADVPYIIESCNIKGEIIICRTTLGEEIILGPSHELIMRNGKPYAMVRAGCEGRMTTQVYYQLVDAATERNGELFIRSQGAEFSLGRAA